MFDIFHANALELMKIEKDKQFRLCQRQKGRKGILGGTDKKATENEGRVKKRLK